MVRPAVAVALCAALCAAAVAPPVADRALADDTAVGCAGPTEDHAASLGPHAMIVPIITAAPAPRVAIVTPWIDVRPTPIVVEDRLALAPKTSPPA